MSKFYFPSDAGNAVFMQHWMDPGEIFPPWTGPAQHAGSFSTAKTHWQWCIVIVRRLCIKSHRATGGLWCILMSQAMFGLVMSVPRSRERC